MLYDQISSDIVAAMKAKDKMRLLALRNVKKFFIEAKTAPGANDELTDEAALKILAKLAKQGRETAQVYTEQNRPDLAEDELKQVQVIEAYLPKQMEGEELRAAVAAVIAEVGATSMADMGKVMGRATKALAGKADGRAISEMVKSLLQP